MKILNLEVLYRIVMPQILSLGFYLKEEINNKTKDYIKNLDKNRRWNNE